MVGSFGSNWQEVSTGSGNGDNQLPGPTITRFNTLRSRQDGRHYPEDIFKCIFLNENVWISNEISLKFVPKGPINNIPSLVQMMAWRRPGDKPLSEPMVVRFTTHICVARPQWVLTYLRHYPKCVEAPGWKHLPISNQIHVISNESRILSVLNELSPLPHV